MLTFGAGLGKQWTVSGTDLLHLQLGENRKVSEFAQYIANLFIVATCHVSKYSQHQ